MRFPEDIRILRVGDGLGLHWLVGGSSIIERIPAFPISSLNAQTLSVNPLRPSSDELSVAFANSFIALAAYRFMQNLQGPECASDRGNQCSVPSASLGQ